MENYLIDKHCTISEMSRILKVGKHTLIHYEKEGMVSPVLRGENGYRYYSGEQISQFKTILYLRELGFSIEEIKIYLKESDYSWTLKQIEEKLKKNQQEIDELLEKKRKLLEGKNSLEYLKEIEQREGVPSVRFFGEMQGIYLPQNSFELKATVKNMKKIDNLLGDITWTEKHSFGFIVSKENIIDEKYEPEKFVLAKYIKEYENTYTFISSEYAVLYTSSQESYKIVIENFLEWIRENNFKIKGDLFIEDVTNHSISNKHSPWVKILKIPVEKY
ncbi:MAG: MerR family transcriptional regulator [Fusobacteriaceae bacterium]